MLLHSILCSSSLISSTVTAAVDIIGGVGTSARGKCHPANKVPLMIIHGETDDILKYDEASAVHGYPFMSASERVGDGGRGVGGGRGRDESKGWWRVAVDIIEGVGTSVQGKCHPAN